MCVSVCEFVHMGVDAQGGQKGALDPLELKIQAVVSLLTWVLGNTLELGSSPRSVNALKQ